MQDIAEQLLERIVLGEAAKGFMESELGQYLQERAQNDILDYQAKLQKYGLDQGASDGLRLEIKARILMFEWLAEAISIADNSEQLLNQAEQED